MIAACNRHRAMQQQTQGYRHRAATDTGLQTQDYRHRATDTGLQTQGYAATDNDCGMPLI